MNRKIVLAGSVLALCSTILVAQDAPESLLPPGFGDPAPAPPPAAAPSVTPRPAPAAPSSGGSSTPLVQSLPGTSTPAQVPAPSHAALPADFPTVAEIEAMTTEQVDELLGLKPKYDIPPAARRSLEQVGVIDQAEGGFASGSLAGQPASLVRAAIKGTRGPVVSRWGHILLRRALASRLDAPVGMNPVEFAALRAGLLNRIGENIAARSLVQDIDTANYNPALTDAAVDAYIATGDIVGTCPSVRLLGDTRKDPQWLLLTAICAAYSDQGSSADKQFKLARKRSVAPAIDILLAQRFAGAAGKRRRTVTIEWDKVDELSPWRFSLATALGIEIPGKFLADAGPYYQRAAATGPMMPLPMRAKGAGVAARDGILSSAAMVDLYAQIYANDEIEGPFAVAASRLREAYIAETPQARMAAIRDLWGDGRPDYAHQVLTARAAARLPASEDFAEDAGPLIASMLSAGLDRNAMQWGAVVPEGSYGWALLALAKSGRNVSVSTDALDGFIDQDESADQRRSRFLLAGLAGLGRIDGPAIVEMSDRLEVKLGRETRWSQMISRAAKAQNPALVALLAGVGMQGDSWDRMTARHLYKIVSALREVGLDAEARMIAAEAVARA